jgi:hypothetical protein
MFSPRKFGGIFAYAHRSILQSPGLNFRQVAEETFSCYLNVSKDHWSRGNNQSIFTFSFFLFPSDKNFGDAESPLRAGS